MMKKYTFSIFLYIFTLLSFLISPINIVAFPIQANEITPIPEYAKWSRLALKETMKKYPNAKIIDYLHIGRENVSPDIAQEKFKLLLKQNNKEFGLLVTVTFQVSTNTLIRITFKETTT